MKLKQTERKAQGRYRTITSGHRADPKLLEQFDDMVTTYDPGMSRTKAITKLMKWALKEYYIPGYERIDRPAHPTIEERNNEKFGTATPVYDGDEGKTS